MIVLGGAGLTVVDVAGRTILQRSIRDESLGRVFGLQESLAMAGLALGSVLVSIFATALGLVATIAIVAAIQPLMVLVTWRRLAALDRRAAVPVRALELLRRTPLFRPPPAPELESIARRGTWLTVPAGTVVIREGDAGDRYYVLDAGAVRVEQAGRNLRDLTSQGDGFGEIALLRDVPRTATVTTTQPSVLFAVDRAPFLAALTGRPVSAPEGAR
ncbi:MAG: cyclic nucleotide-binding domain-containing protein [Candidatus Limnocylindrales bacterium]